MTRPQPSTSGKLFLSLGLVIVSVIYALWQNVSTTRSGVVADSPSQSFKVANDNLNQTLTQIGASTSGSSTSAAAPSTTPAPVATPAPAVTTKPAGQYADGSYTGSAANAYYGTVQVKAVISGSKLADVQFLQYPNDRSNSRYINNQAMPLLKQEAIVAQSAQVDGVSGATFTSQAFIESLTSALAQAKA